MFRRNLVQAGLVVMALTAAAGSGSDSEPLSLGRALDLAVERSPVLAAARADARTAQAESRLADSAARPHVEAGASYTYLSLPTLFGGQEVFKRSTQIHSAGLRMPLYDRSISEGRSAAHLASLARSKSADAALEEVLVEVAARYWAVAAAREQASAAEDALSFLEANVKRVQATRDAGAATRGDVLRAEADAAVARDRLLAAKNGVDVALAALKLSIGLNQPEQVEVPQGVLHPDPGADRAAEAPSPRVGAAEVAHRAALSGVKAARAGDDPRVGLAADAVSVAQGAEFPRRDGSVSATVQLVIPIFDGGTTRAQVEKATAQVERAASDLKSAEDYAAFRRTAARFALDNARERWKATEQQVESAVESRRLVDAGYREGINNQTDVLGAQSAVATAQASRIQSLVDLKVAEAGWLAAISRLDVLLDGGR